MMRPSTDLVRGTVRDSAADQPLNLKPLLDGTFRANPEYELLAFDELPAAQQELFSELRDDPDFYGILMPRSANTLPVKSACRDTARLFLSLSQAAKLPRSIAGSPATLANSEIAGLVLDGVLQFLHEGDLVHGAAALTAICEPASNNRGSNEIAQLSRDALLYAQSLPFTDVGLVAARLYAYGRIPATSSWKKTFPHDAAVRQCLLIADRGRNAVRLHGRWQELPRDPENDGWIFWQSKAPAERRKTAYKLYVSPGTHFLREGFEALIAGAECGGAIAFKIGKNLSGVLRPDKMIAYFSHFEQLQKAASQILDELKGCPSHGVPFTSQIDSPLVSWGIDPPASEGAPSWLARQSWRLWVANRLAVALSVARQDPRLSTEPWQFALDRLRLDGVDTDTWTPLGKEDN